MESRRSREIGLRLWDTERIAHKGNRNEASKRASKVRREMKQRNYNAAEDKDGCFWRVSSVEGKAIRTSGNLWLPGGMGNYHTQKSHYLHILPHSQITRGITSIY